MKVIIKGEPKEIAAPAQKTQERQGADVPVGYERFMEKLSEQVSRAIGLTASRDTCG